MNRQFFEKSIVVIVGALICCILWGSAFPCIKLGYKELQIEAVDTASQILFAGIRFFLAGILATLFFWIQGRKVILPNKRTIPKIFVLSIFQTILQYLCFYVGLAHTTGVKASIIEGVSVFVAIFISGLGFRQEKVTLRKFLGCMIGFAGVILVNISNQGMDFALSWMGEGAIFLSTVAYAFSTVIMKEYSKRENPVMLSAFQFMLGGFVMIIIGWGTGGHVATYTYKGVALLIYLALVSACAYTIWSILMKYNPVSRVAVYSFMNPVFGVLLSAILLQEQDTLNISGLGALGLICVGIFIVNRKSDLE